MSPLRRPAVRASLALSLSLVSSGRSARALGNVEGEIALEGGWGATNDVLYSNAFGPGFGLRGGVSIYGIYVGAVGFNWYGQTGGFGAQQFGGEVGYGFRFLDGFLTIRPQLGAGALFIDGTESNDAAAPGADWVPPRGAMLTPGLATYCQPGVTALVSLGKWAFAGTNASLFILPGAARNDYPTYDRTTPVGVTLDAQLGLKF